MPSYFREPEDLTIEESFALATLADLKPLGRALSSEAPMRKCDLVPFLVNKLRTKEQAEALYKRLNELGQAAVQEATHDPDGILDLERFQAKYGHVGTPGGQPPGVTRLSSPDIGRHRRAGNRGQGECGRGAYHGFGSLESVSSADHRVFFNENMM
jgi:hypothetical protein